MSARLDKYQKQIGLKQTMLSITTIIGIELSQLFVENASNAQNNS